MNKRLRRKSVAVLAVAALAAGMFAALGPVPGGASSHREAPIISRDPGVDNTDLYAFRSPDRPGFITLISNWWPFSEPAGGPNFFSFDPNARYDFNIDNDGDAKTEITYRFTFDNHYNSKNTFLYNTGQVTSLNDPNLNFYQTFDLKRLARSGTTTLLNDRRVVPNRVGNASMPDYVDDLFMPGRYGFGPSTNRAFAGQSDDPFFADLRVFDLLYGTDFSEVGDDTLAGFNTQVLALQIRRTDLVVNNSQPIIGVWAAASRRSTRVQQANGRQDFSGKFAEVSRLGMPLVNEVVVPVGDKDKWNSSNPANDGQFLSYVTHPELPELIEAIYGVPAPSTPRNDLVDIFLRGLAGLNRPPGVVASEMLRLNTSTPTCEPPGCGAYSRLGVIDGDNSGYPNGRRLADDAIDISLDVMEDLPAGSLSDSVDLNDVPFLTQFPYVAAPHSGSDPMPH
ncbi:MAG: DUF4331 domain-containing protein [Actinomycetota bacterium]